MKTKRISYQPFQKEVRTDCRDACDGRDDTPPISGPTGGAAAECLMELVSRCHHARHIRHISSWHHFGMFRRPRSGSPQTIYGYPIGPYAPPPLWVRLGTGTTRGQPSDGFRGRFQSCPSKIRSCKERLAESSGYLQEYGLSVHEGISRRLSGPLQ